MGAWERKEKLQGQLSMRESFSENKALSWQEAIILHKESKVYCYKIEEWLLLFDLISEILDKVLVKGYKKLFFILNFFGPKGF